MNDPIIYSPFLVSDLFEVIIGKAIDGNKAKLNENGTPYITRKVTRNGFEFMIDGEAEKLYSGKLPVITIGNETSKPFVQEFHFFTGTKVNICIPKLDLKRNHLLYVATMIENATKMFSYSYTINSTRLKNLIILLPIKEQEPDWGYMDTYVANMFSDIEKNIEIEKNEDIEDLRSLDDLLWNPFKMDDIFTIDSGVRLTKANMRPGRIPFIGATDSNNGITEFTSNTNVSIDRNVLGVNYNGSVVENFYHPYSAVFSDDVKRLKLKGFPNNKHVLLFMKAVILQQKVKYAYGYKFNATRMKEQIILLPTKEDGTPDYKFMEQYMKRMGNKINEQIKIEVNQK
ncbi:restriction endonuclease subunit S [Sporosarcina sp. SG10008]|uniref:restriction endonuclease subunit S n=1 Tax=Sporosarcina sp. SG10008 TaxID=3373103 RepID=UPI0037DDCE0E